MKELSAPRYRTGFVGRRPELAALRRALAGPGLVLVVGPGGVGKTRLAAEAVAGRRAAFVDLTAARTPAEAASEILRAAGETRPGPEDPVTRAAAALSAVPCDVVVLDNLEQLEGAAEFVAGLRPAGDPRSWLLTSRHPLRGADVRVDVGPFEVTAAADEAVDLFLRVLAASGAAPVARERLLPVVRGLEGLPLAIELAAGRAAVLSIEEIQARLSDPLPLLVDPVRGADKASALWRSVAWSVDLVSPQARRALARSSVFAGPLGEEAARAVLGADGWAAIAELADLGLVRVEGGKARPYEVVRRYAGLLLAREGGEAEAIEAHARWCAGIRPVPGSQEMQEAFAEHGGELERVVERAGAPGASEGLRAAGLAIAHRWHVAWMVAWSRDDFVRRAGALAERLDSAEAAVVAQRRAAALLDQGRVAEGEAELRRVLAAARAHGWAEARALALQSLAGAALLRDDLADLEALGTEAVEVAREAGLVHLERKFLVGPMGVPLLHQGRTREVWARLQRARALAADLPMYLPAIQVREAQLLLEEGDWEGVARRLGGVDREQLPPIALLEWRFVAVKLALIREPRPADEVAALGRGLPLPSEQAQFDLLLAAARLLEGGVPPATVEATIAAAPFGAGRPENLDRMVLELAAVGCDRVPAALTDGRDPVMRSFSEALALVRRHVAGALTATEALARIDALRPDAWELHLARRVLWDRERRARAVTVAADGAWFERGGVRHPIRGEAHRRLLAALAGAPGGLAAEALAASGWPGRLASGPAAGNRVRVAVTHLRRAGVPVGYQRGRGWFLEDPAPATSPPVPGGGRTGPEPS